MVWARAAFVVLLGSSLATNGYLLLHRSSSADTTAPRAEAPSVTKTKRPRRPPRADEPPRILAVPADIVALDRAAREKRLAEAEAKRDALLPLSKRFELQEPSPEDEARLKPFLDGIFSVEVGAEPSYDLECRGHICRIESTESSIDWRAAIQQDFDGVGLFAAGEFHDSGVVYQRLHEPGRAAGINWSFRVIMALRTSAALRTCKRENSAPGLVELALQLDRVTKHVTVIATGTLADQPIGVCMRRVMEDLIARTPPPREITAVHEEPISIRVGAP